MPHDEGEARCLRLRLLEQRAMICANQPQVIRPPALHEAQIARVIDDAGEVWFANIATADPAGPLDDGSIRRQGRWSLSIAGGSVFGIGRGSLGVARPLRRRLRVSQPLLFLPHKSIDCHISGHPPEKASKCAPSFLLAGMIPTPGIIRSKLPQTHWNFFSRVLACRHVQPCLRARVLHM
jgi:hypothetical protein